MKKAINIIFTVLATLAVLNCGGTVEVPEIPDIRIQNTIIRMNGDKLISMSVNVWERLRYSTLPVNTPDSWA